MSDPASGTRIAALCLVRREDGALYGLEIHHFEDCSCIGLERDASPSRDVDLLRSRILTHASPPLAG
jgi:hypothetical protein